MSNAGNLTKYPCGTFRELWAINMPIMLSLASGYLMLLIDQLLLSHYDPRALNGSLVAGTAIYVFLVFPMTIAIMSEILVARLYGNGKTSEMAAVVWELLLGCAAMVPIFILIALYAPPIIFFNSTNYENESVFFRIMTYFSPVQAAIYALSGFFIGTGRAKVITWIALLGNLINLVLDYLFIFGWNFIPSMGVRGAAWASGISFSIQMILLLIIFLNKYNRSNFHTDRITFKLNYFYESLKLGVPVGLGRFLEFVVLFGCLRIASRLNQNQMTMISITQSIYVFTYFINESISKSVGTITAFMIGSKKQHLINTLFFSATRLLLFFFLILFVIFYFFPDSILQLYLGKQEIFTANEKKLFYHTLIILSFFFLLDSVSFSFSSIFIARGYPNFVLGVTALTCFLGYLLPIFLAGHYGFLNPVTFWILFSFGASLALFFYSLRYARMSKIP